MTIGLTITLHEYSLLYQRCSLW